MAKPVNRRAVFLKIAKELGLTMKEVEAAVDSQFQFVANTMKSDTFAQIRLPYFGRFWVKPGRLKYLQKFGLRVPSTEEEDE